MENTQSTLKNWVKCDKAQLKNFLTENKGKEILINNIAYRVNSGFMDDYNVPQIGLIKKGTGQLKYVQLDLIDASHKNYSALGETGRKDLMKKLGIK